MLARLFLVLLLMAGPVMAGVSLKKQLAETKLSSVNLGKVSFEEASFDEAMGLFEQLFDKEMKGKIKLQWVYQGFERKSLKKTVTLSGDKVSAGKMLAEIVKQCGLKVRLDEHAIVLSVAKEGKPVSGAEREERRVEERESPLGRSRLEPGGLDGTDWDRQPVKGRNPLKRER